MKNKFLSIITLLLLALLICLTGCQEQNNQNGNQTNGKNDDKNVNKFLGDWEAIIDPPEYESWSFYENHTVKNYLLQKFEDQILPSTTWFDYTYDTTTLCFSTGTPGSPEYFSICYSYAFSQNTTRLTLSSNGIVIIDLIKL